VVRRDRHSQGHACHPESESERWQWRGGGSEEEDGEEGGLESEHQED